MPRPQGVNVAREERLTRIAALLAENPKLSQRELAALVGVGKSQIDRDIDALQSEWHCERIEMRDKLVEGHHWELMQALRAIRAKALNDKNPWQSGDLGALVKILESDRRLLGLDAPTRKDITSGGEKIIGGFLAATGLDDDTLSDIARGSEEGDLPPGGPEAS